jgi:hypothetical protein
MRIALDITRRALVMAPFVIMLGGFWGAPGAISTAYALGIVVLNFLLAAWMLSVTGRISFAAMAGAAMFGYLIRLALIWGAIELVRDTSWMRTLPLGITLIVTHLALLWWEVRYVSNSFAYPGLKPTAKMANYSTADSAADRRTPAA